MREDWDHIGEQLLVIRSRSGDPTAFADLVDRFAPRLRYFLGKLLGEPDAGENLSADYTDYAD